MPKPTKVDENVQGRSATGRGLVVTVCLPEATLADVERWAVSQVDQPARSQAICRLVEVGLTIGATQKPSLPGVADRAKELAGTAIDKMSDDSATDADQASRKRRLLKRPNEFL